MPTQLSVSGGLTRTSSGLVITRAALDDWSEVLVSDSPSQSLLVNCRAFLFTNPVVPTGLSVYADFNKPTWAGWALGPEIEWSRGASGTAGWEIEASGLSQWIVGANPNTALWGWGLVKGTVLLAAEIWPEPITPQVGQVLSLIPAITIAL